MLNREQAEHAIESILDFIADHSDTIVEATTKLGIPIEDCICSSVQTARKRTVISEQQMKLFREKKKANA